MTLSPTALEAATKAVEAAELAWKAANGGDKASCVDCPDEVKATAAITAYLAQAEKEGWVLVPEEPTREQLDALAAACRETWGVNVDRKRPAPVFTAEWRERMRPIYRAAVPSPLAAAQNGGE